MKSCRECVHYEAAYHAVGFDCHAQTVQWDIVQVYKPKDWPKHCGAYQPREEREAQP